MKTKFLLPNRFKRFGIILFLIALSLLLYTQIIGEISFLTNVPVMAVIYGGSSLFDNQEVHSPFFNMINDDIQFELIYVLFILAGLFIAFSRQKNEDEYISKIRLESLVWSTYVNYIILIILTLTVYGAIFLLIFWYTTFTTLILFIIRFNYLLYKSNKASE